MDITFSGRKSLHALCAFLISITAFQVEASLETRLGGLAVYDADQDLTWLADANLAGSKTFGLARSATLDGGSVFFGQVGPNGELDQHTASTTWINAMNSDGDSGYLGVNSWRLPATTIPDPGCSLDGTGADFRAGYNCTLSEMGHLFYNELGGSPMTSILNSSDPDLALFNNIQDDYYWSKDLWDIPDEGAFGWWTLGFHNGYQVAEGNDLWANHAWPVADGDVFAVIPVPASIWLFSSGLFMLINLARARR